MDNSKDKPKPSPGFPPGSKIIEEKASEDFLNNPLNLTRIALNPQFQGIISCITHLESMSANFQAQANILNQQVAQMKETAVALHEFYKSHLDIYDYAMFIARQDMSPEQKQNLLISYQPIIDILTGVESIGCQSEVKTSNPVK